MGRLREVSPCSGGPTRARARHRSSRCNRRLDAEVSHHSVHHGCDQVADGVSPNNDEPERQHRHLPPALSRAFEAMFLLAGGPPRAVMASAMQSRSHLLPLSHLLGGLRLAWLDTTDDPYAL